MLFAELALPARDLRDDLRRSLGRDAGEAGEPAAVAGEADGDEADGLHAGVEGGEVGDAAREVLIVVDPGADDELGMELDPPWDEAAHLRERVGRVAAEEPRDAPRARWPARRHRAGKGGTRRGGGGRRG